MKKLLLVTAFVVVAVSSYMLGTTQGKAEIPNNYVDMNSEEFHENFIDMREVWNFETTGSGGLFLYLHNGEGYYWGE